MNTYTNVFGGENVNPADLSYKAYGTALAPLAANIQLDWPFEALDGALVVADKIDVLANAGHTITMPDATLVSVGEDVLWNNVGANAFTVLDYLGNNILTVQPGTQWFTYLIDNTTQAGTWRTTQFGASTSVANAAALAGAGLRANTSLLDQNLITSNSLIGAQSLTAASRARVFRNTGGSAIHTIDPAASLGPPPLPNNGWFVVEINGGTGNVTITPTAPDLIDGVATKVLGPGESCTVYCFGTGFATMGYGRAISTSVSGVSIDASAGTGDIVLNTTQIAAQVQDFTGTLTANRNIVYGDVTGYWFIYNHTTGSFTLTFKGGLADTTPFTVAQNTFIILRSQAGQLDIAFTLGLGSVTSITTVAGEITGGTPTPITSTGTIGLSDMPTGIANLTPGTYPTVPGGSTSSPKVPLIRVDGKGRIQHAEDLFVAINANAIADLGIFMPSGVMLPFGGITLPPNTYWLPCDGTTRLRADYLNLFAAISTTYNTGGELGTEFRLPDTRGRALAGVDDGANRLTTAGLSTPAVLGAGGGTQSNAAATTISSSGTNNINFGSPAFNFTGGSGRVTGSSGSGMQFGGGGLFVQAGDGITVDSLTGYTTVNGNFGISVSGSNTSSAFSTTQPTLIIRYIIKT